VLGLESIRDQAGNTIQEAPLPVWANLRQRALDTAIAEINKKNRFEDLAGGIGALPSSTDHYAYSRHKTSATPQWRSENPWSVLSFAAATG
jgi:hypothetical protein